MMILQSGQLGLGYNIPNIDNVDNVPTGRQSAARVTRGKTINWNEKEVGGMA